MRNRPHDPYYEPGAFDAEGRFLFIKSPDQAELEKIYALTLTSIGPGVAGPEVVQSVLAHNPSSFWAFMRSANAARSEAELVGYCSLLPLNADGTKAIEAGTFDSNVPGLAHLSKKGEAPASLYLWAIVAPGTADLGGKLIAHALGLDLFLQLPVFGRIGTESGLRALKRRSDAWKYQDSKVGSYFEILHPNGFAEELRALEVIAGRRL